MPAPSEQAVSAEIVDRLEHLMGAPAHAERDVSPDGRSRPDAVIRVGGDAFVVEYKRSSSAATVAGAIQQVLHYVERSSRGKKRLIPLIVVPYMPPAGRGLAAERGVSWLDLSGNASIRTPRTLVKIEGQPNRFKQRGRPSTPFAPKSSRVVRWFLMNPGHDTTQQGLAEATGVDPGQVSRVVRRLLSDELLRRTATGALAVPDPDLLLDAWRSEYDFSKHTVVEGHIPARSGRDALTRLSGALEAAGADYAATGLAGAWLLTQFAAFRLVTVYVRERVPADLLDDLGFRAEPRGANTWLATPNDAGVLDGAEAVEGVRCAHPVQVYLDLVAQPERADEAASELRRRLLTWNARAG